MVIEEGETAYQKNSREKFNRFVDKNVNEMLGQILKAVEIAVPNKDQYKIVRKQILRTGNDFGREIKFEIEANYRLHWMDTKEDLIKFGSPTKNETN